MKFRFFQIEVTRRCNLRCIHCPSRIISSKRDMNFSTFLRISEYFNKTQTIHLQGWGEPFIHPEILEMIRIAKDHAKTGLTTNGTQLKRFAEDIVSLQLDYIAVSISGPETHGAMRRGSSFESVVRGVEHLNEVKKKANSSLPVVNLTFLVTKTNFTEIPLAFKTALKLKTGLILTNLDYVFDEETYRMRAFESEISRDVEGVVKNVEREAITIPFKRPLFRSQEMAVCDAFPTSAMVFSVEGDVFPCVYLSLPFKEIPRYFHGKRILVERPKFGNVMEGLEKVWDSAFYSSFREKFRRRIEAAKSIRFSLGLANFSKLPLPECCRGCYKLFGI